MASNTQSDNEWMCFTWELMTIGSYALFSKDHPSESFTRFAGMEPSASYEIFLDDLKRFTPFE